MSVKWHNLKVILRYSEGMDQPIVTPQWPMLFDLGSDPGELYNVFADKMDMGWMLGVALKFVADYQRASPSTRTSRRAMNSTVTQRRPQRQGVDTRPTTTSPNRR